MVHYRQKITRQLLCGAMILASATISASAQGLPPSAYSSSQLQTSSPSSGSRWGTLQFLGPDTIADIAAAIAPAVVKIDIVTSSMVDTRRRTDRGPRQRVEAPLPLEKGTGSGVVIKSDGVILTSNHLIEPADRINVTLSDG